MAFEFEKLPKEAQKAAFAAMDRDNPGGRSGGGTGEKKAASKAASTTSASRVADAYRKLARSPGSWVGIIDLRKELKGMSRAEQDSVMKEMSRKGQVHIAPESNRKALRQPDHDAALRLGGDDNHIIQMYPAQLEEFGGADDKPEPKPEPKKQQPPRPAPPPTKKTSGPAAAKTGSKAGSPGERAAQRAAQRRADEDRVLAEADKLDPNDRSVAAQQLRETAESIRDHRSSAAVTGRSETAAVRISKAKKLPLNKLDSTQFEQELTSARQSALDLRRQRDRAQRAGAQQPSGPDVDRIEQRARDAEAENARRFDANRDALEVNTAAALRDWKSSGDPEMDRLDLDVLYHSARGAELKKRIKERMDALPAKDTIRKQDQADRAAGRTSQHLDSSGQVKGRISRAAAAEAMFGTAGAAARIAKANAKRRKSK